MKRSSGILMPIASLPSRYGIGCLDEAAYEFVDQLEKAGQGYWQILPMGPTGYGIHPISPFLPLLEIRIFILFVRNWQKRGDLSEKIFRNTRRQATTRQFLTMFYMKSAFRC